MEPDLARAELSHGKRRNVFLVPGPKEGCRAETQDGLRKAKQHLNERFFRKHFCTKTQHSFLPETWYLNLVFSLCLSNFAQ